MSAVLPDVHVGVLVRSWSPRGQWAL